MVSQGNFHGEIVALTCDAMSLALFELGSILSVEWIKCSTHPEANFQRFWLKIPDWNQG